MGHIAAEDIRGYYVGAQKELVCDEHIRASEEGDLKEDDILTEGEMNEEDYYFCDRCRKRL